MNLAPAEIKKEGPYFDLPIAVGILISTEAIKQQGLEDTIFIGELSLDGKLMKVNGILPICIEAKYKENNNSKRKCARGSDSKWNRNNWS